VHVRTLLVVGDAGVTLADVSAGALFTTTTAVELTAVPVAVPSPGVTVQTMLSVLLNCVDPSSVLVVWPARTVPFFAQAYVYTAASPSGSVNPFGVQVSVLFVFGDAGVTLTDARAGAVFAITTAVELIGVPVAEPSPGVTVHTMLSVLLNCVAPSSVLPVWPAMTVPFFAQAYA
jgi:hypothetical protein